MSLKSPKNGGIRKFILVIIKGETLELTIKSVWLVVIAVAFSVIALATL